MKRLLLAALLGVVAAVLAPVASASAAEAVECKFRGTAKFTAALGLEPKESGYTFESEGVGANKCNGTEGSASVQGKGKLSCSVSPGLGIGGLVATFEKGSLTAKGKTFTLSKFEFVGAGAAVPFAAEGASGAESFAGSGVANFVETVPALHKCERGELASVAFEATAAGVVR